jgi:hypothetical protein
MNIKLSPHQKIFLPSLEDKLKLAVRDGNHELAITLTDKIQSLFAADRSHYRLLRAKLWCFEASLNANSLSYAETGLLGVRGLASIPSKIYVEASALLTVCCLRKKKIESAKEVIDDVLGKLKCIKSDRNRRSLHKRFKERVEDECLLSGLIDNKANLLNVGAVHSVAVKLLEEGSSETALFEFLGKSVPQTSPALLKSIRDYSSSRVSSSDQKLLYPPGREEQPAHIGRKTFSIIGRVVWKGLCHPEGRIYKIWSAKVPEVYGESYFAASIVTAMKEWQIGSSLFAGGVVAIVMKYSASEFCRLAKPKSLICETEDGV